MVVAFRAAAISWLAKLVAERPRCAVCRSARTHRYLLHRDVLARILGTYLAAYATASHVVHPTQWLTRVCSTAPLAAPAMPAPSALPFPLLTVTGEPSVGARCEPCSSFHAPPACHPTCLFDAGLRGILCRYILTSCSNLSLIDPRE